MLNGYARQHLYRIRRIEILQYNKSSQVLTKEYTAFTLEVWLVFNSHDQRGSKNHISSIPEDIVTEPTLIRVAIVI